MLYAARVLGAGLLSAARDDANCAVTEGTSRHESAVVYTGKDCLQTISINSTQSPTRDHPGNLIN